MRHECILCDKYFTRTKDCIRFLCPNCSKETLEESEKENDRRTHREHSSDNTSKSEGRLF